jgi:1-acyl-sn-glycerol-3-phosphate acyltransferase
MLWYFAMIQTTIPSFSVTNYDPMSRGSRILAMRWQRITRVAMIPFMALASRGIKFEFTAESLRDDITYVVVSNHQSQWDTFVELSAFSKAIAARLLPFRAMTQNKVLMGGLQSNYLLGMGCFPAKPHPKFDSGVHLAVALVEDGQTVFIAPEGRRTLPSASSPRPGVLALAKLKNVELLPAHIQWKRPHRFQKTFKLTFGKPFDAKGMSPKDIMDRIYALELP